MKKLIEFTVVKKQETTVVVQYDDRDAHTKADLERFACEVINQERHRSRPRYEWGDTEIYVESTNDPAVNCGNHIEVAPRPCGWLLTRMRAALAGAMDGCAFGIPGAVSMIEELPASEGWMFRRVIMINGQKLMPENCVLKMADLIAASGELDVSHFQDFVGNIPSTANMTEYDVVWYEFRHRVNTHMGTSLSAGEFKKRFCDAFGWDENGRCV